ncbi:hypothetical protein VaNZ11_008141 [Volvox africanus]|uniref:Serine-threonine/tyrosine-protein kinase catalytic domain-containing protein n=1 Tax=Volvox africanus TaxID=51714 RepID=A0ABQ5S5B2_9CHLO|nr:hypothetical protein VaNZ11_008141 [Volvox africanus]
MSGDDVGFFGKACRLLSCLAGSSGSTAGSQRFGAHGNGTLATGPCPNPAGLSRPNCTAGISQDKAPASILRHNPIDVCLTLTEPVSVLQGNPGQRTYEAAWCGVPVHLHVLTFVKRPNPIAQLPGPTSPHATVAAALDAPPPAQANMLAQPDMISVATDVEAALVQLIAEPTPQVLPVLACAKVTCRAHIGSPGDEHVTQRIIAEVHIVTPRMPGLVSLSQWLHERWPQCEVINDAGDGATDADAVAGAPANAPAAAGDGGGSAMQPSATGVPSAPPQLTVPGTRSHRLAASTNSACTATPGARGTCGVSSANGGSDVQSVRLAGTGTSLTAAPGMGQGANFAIGPSACRLGGSQPIAEGVSPGDRVRSGGEQLTAMATAPRASRNGTDGDTVATSIPCFRFCFAPAEAPPPPPSLLPDRSAGSVCQGTPLSEQGGKAAPGDLVGSALVAPARGAVAVPPPSGIATNTGANGGARRLALPAPNATLGIARQRFPLPPPPPQRPKLPLPEALEVLICLAEALRNLHCRGLTHGSLTPKTIQLQIAEVEAAAAVTEGIASEQQGEQAQAASQQGRCPTAPQSAGTSQTVSRQQSPLQTQTQSSSQPAPDVIPGVDPVDRNPGVSAPGTSTVESPDNIGAGADKDRAEPPGDVGEIAAPTAGGDAVAAPANAASGTTVAAVPKHGAPVETQEMATAPAVTSVASPMVTGGAAGEGCDGGPREKVAEAISNQTAAQHDTGATGTGTGGAVDTRPDSGVVGGDGAVGAGASDTLLRQPVVPAAPAPSPKRPKSALPVRRRKLGRDGRIRAMLSLPAVGPAMLQLQTWGRARLVGLPRDHMLWCAPELLNGGGLGWGLPVLARRSGNGSGSMSLGPLDQSVGCRNGSRQRAGNHHNRHFGDGSYGGSLGGNSRRFRCASSLLMGQDAGGTTASAHGITPSCDVYSLGMLMWYLVSGQPPFQHLATQDQVLRVKEIGSLDEQLPFSTELPAGYVQLARRCWAPLPMQRPCMNVVLSEMRSLRAHLFGLPANRDLAGDHNHGFGYGGSSMGEMTGDSRLSFTLSLPLSSRDLSNGDDNYSLVRPPLELAFGANDASGGKGGSAAGADGGGDLSACNSAPPPPPPPLKSSLPAALLTALTAPRRASGGGGGGLMDDDDNYSDTDRFTEHADTNEHTEASGGGTAYSSPTGGTTGGGRSGVVNGTSGRVRSTATAAARSFRMFRGLSHRPGSTAGSARSGGGCVIPAALLAATGSRCGAGQSHAPTAWANICDSFSGPAGTPPYQQQLVARASVHASIGKQPGTAAAAASMGGRCASSSALVGLSGSTPTPPTAGAGLRLSQPQSSGSCAAAAAAAANGSTAGGSGVGGPSSGSSRMSAMISATSASLGCLTVPCGHGTGNSNT